jgi:hypothetical protein
MSSCQFRSTECKGGGSGDSGCLFLIVIFLFFGLWDVPMSSKEKGRFDDIDRRLQSIESQIKKLETAEKSINKK